MILSGAYRRSGQAHLKRLVESVPEITNSVLSSGGGVLAAWPLRPTLRIIGLAATTPEILGLMGHVLEPIENDQIEASTVRMRRGRLLTASVSDELSLKVYFPLTVKVDAHLWNIVKTIREIRATSNLR